MPFLESFTIFPPNFSIIVHFTKINEVIDGAVILIERSHYDDSVLEIIAPVSIRKKLGIADGDTVRIDIFTEYT